MYTVIWSEEEGGLSIIGSPEDAQGVKKGHTYERAEQIAKNWKAKDYEIILLSDLPSEEGDNLAKNQAFRAAWIHDKTDSARKVGINMTLARDISLIRVRANVTAQFVELNKEAQIAMSDGMTLDQARELTRERGDKLKTATDRLKALDVNNDGIISVEEAAGLLLPLELIA